MKWQEITHPEDVEESQAIIDSILAGERDSARFTKRYFHKNGSVVWADVSTSVRRDGDGKALYFMTAAADVTERKRAELALRASEEKYHYMFANNPQAMWIYDLETLAFLEVNDAAILRYGYTKEEFLSMTLKEIRPKEDISALLKDVEQTQGTYNPGGQWRHLKKNGELMHVEIVSHSITFQGRDARHVMVHDITERKRGESALRASEVRYRRLFEAARDGILILDAETGAVVDVNPFLIEMLGYPREEFLGKKLWELGFFKDIAANQENFEELQRNDYIRYEDLPLETADGRRMQVEFVSNVYLVDDRKVIQCNIRDISERKRAEEELRETVRILNDAQTVAQLGWYVYDVATGLWQSSVLLDGIFGIGSTGYPKTADGWSAIVHPDDRQAMQEYLLHEVLEEGAQFDREYRIVRQTDNEERWVYGLGNLVKDGHGKIVKMIGVIQDITERKRADEALREGEERERLRSEELSALLDAMPAAVWITRDPAGLHMTSNRLGAEWTRIREGANVSKSAPVGERPEGFKACKDGQEIPPEDLPVQVAARGKEVRTYEFDLAYPDGSSRHLLGNATPLKDRTGQPRGAVSAFIDITERKRAEEEIIRLNENLEKRVQERTAELDAANRELESFAYSVSHDLRAPLRGIDGWSHALLDDYGKVLDRTATGYLDTIRAEAQRMSELIDAMLELSKVTRGDLRKEPVDLPALAKTVETALREESPGQAVEFVLAPDLGAVEGDSRLVRVILQNLLRNAWKFTRKREHARVELGVTRADGHAAYFVRDNGAGFDMAFSANLFKPFQRLHQTDEFPGVGVGLATVQRIVRRHGGTIWAEGEVGKGATFYFTLGK